MGFLRSAGVEKKKRAMNIVTSAEPIVDAIMRKFRDGPTAATHIVPAGAVGMTGVLDDMRRRQREHGSTLHRGLRLMNVWGMTLDQSL